MGLEETRCETGMVQNDTEMIWKGTEWSRWDKKRNGKGMETKRQEPNRRGLDAFGKVMIGEEIKRNGNEQNRVEGDEKELRRSELK